MATVYWLTDRGIGVRIPVESRILSTLYRLERLWAHPAFYLMGIGDVLRLKRRGREADNSTPNSPEVKKTRIYTFIPVYVFMA
jgi:hypothetical protein